MKTMRMFWAIIGVILLEAGAALAIDSNAGTAGLQFLKIGIGARQIAAGEAACAAGQDANTIYMNPAGLAGLNKAQAVFSHNQSFANISLQSVAASYPVSSGVIGVGFVYMHMDEMTGYDIDAQGSPVKTSDFTSSDMAVTLSYGTVYRGLPVGVNVKFIQEKLQNYQANGVAVDIGAMKQVSNNVNLGAAVQNLGPAMKFISEATPLPTNIKLGAAYRTDSKDMLVTFDVNKAVDSGFKASLGAEYNVNNMLFLRAGYSDKAGLNRWITAGIGLAILDWSVDYAYVPFGELGDTHRISISTKLGK